MIDLHMHSTYSDGTDSPEELLKKAKSLGVSAIALTDHDSIEGIAEFLNYGKQYGVTTIAGVEISVDTKLPNNGHMHVLGLFIDPDSDHLKNKLRFLAKERKIRAKKIVEKLSSADIHITLEELWEEAGEGSIGRPHIAKILLRKGYISSIQEGFDKYLAKGKPAYVDKVKLDETAAINMIHEARGLAILAHPHFMNFDNFEAARQRILNLKTLGLDGFEVYYTSMPVEYTSKLLQLAEEHNFVVTGGSDYHGLTKPDVNMGTGKNGDLNVPDNVLAELQKYIDCKKADKFE